jgi:hypothetical protein
VNIIKAKNAFSQNSGRAEKTLEYTRIISLLTSKNGVRTDNLLLSLVHGLDYAEFGTARYGELVDKVVRRLSKDLQHLMPEFSRGSIVLVGASENFSLALAGKISGCNLTGVLSDGNFAMSHLITCGRADETGFFNRRGSYSALTTQMAKSLFNGDDVQYRSAILANMDWLVTKKSHEFFNQHKLIIAGQSLKMAKLCPADTLFVTGMITDCDEVVARFNEIADLYGTAGSVINQANITLFAAPGYEPVRIANNYSSIMQRFFSLKIRPSAFSVFEYDERSSRIGEKIYGNDVCIESDFRFYDERKLDTTYIREWLLATPEDLFERQVECGQFLEKLARLSSYLLCVENGVKYLSRAIYVQLGKTVKNRLKLALELFGEQTYAQQDRRDYGKYLDVSAKKVASRIISAIVTHRIPEYIVNGTVFSAFVKSVDKIRAALFCDGVGEITVYFDQQPEVQNLFYQNSKISFRVEGKSGSNLILVPVSLPNAFA